MKKILTIILGLFAANLFAANPTYQSFNVNQFIADVTGGIALKSGVVITNPTISGGTFSGTAGSATNLVGGITDVWMFTNKVARLPDGTLTNWSASTTAGLQELHNYFPWVTNDQKTIRVHFAAGIYPIYSVLHITNGMTWQGAGLTETIIKSYLPTNTFNLAYVKSKPWSNAVVTLDLMYNPPGQEAAGGFRWYVNRFDCYDVGFQFATNAPGWLLFDAADKGAVARCGFFGPNAFSPLSTYKGLVYKKDAATNAQMGVGICFAGVNKNTFHQNVFVGLADGFYARHNEGDEYSSGDHYEFTENEGGLIGAYAAPPSFGSIVTSNAYPIGNILKVGALVINDSGGDANISFNKVDLSIGCVYISESPALYGVYPMLQGNTAESCLYPNPILVSPGSNARNFGFNFDNADIPITILNPGDFFETNANAASVFTYSVGYGDTGNVDDLGFQIWQGKTNIYSMGLSKGIVLKLPVTAKSTLTQWGQMRHSPTDELYTPVGGFPTVTNWSQISTNGFTGSIVKGAITNLYEGDYLIQSVIYARSDAGGTAITNAIFTNSVLAGIMVYDDISDRLGDSGTSVLDTGLQIFHLPANTKIESRTDANNNNYHIQSGVLTAIKQ